MAPATPGDPPPAGGHDEPTCRQALAGARMGVWQWDLHARTVRADAAALALFGLPPIDAALPAEIFFAHVDADAMARCETLMRRLPAPGEAIDDELRLDGLDGGPRWIAWRGRAGGGDAALLAGVCFDVTPRHRAEAALRESEARFAQFGAASTDVLWIVDAERQRVEYLSPAFETVWGESRERVTADLAHWLDLIHPDDRDVACRAMPELLAGRRCTVEYRIVRPSGQVRCIRDSGFPIVDDAGRVRRAAGIARDVTEQRLAEQRLRVSERLQQTLIDGMPQLVWRAVDGGDWIWSSPQWSDYTGLSGDGSLAWGWLDALHPDDRAPTRTIWSRAAVQGEFQADYRLWHAAERRWRWFQTRATPVRDDDSRAVLEWLGTSTDVDDLRQLQQRQQVLVAELQHRTRNLLAVVRSLAEKTLRASGGLEDFAPRLRDRLDALARVQALLSRLEEGRRVAFDALLRSELAALGAFDDLPGQVTLAGPDGVPLRSGSVQTLALALHELATNALKYGALAQPQGRLAVRWRVEPAPHGGDGPWLHVDWQESGVVLPAAAERRSGAGRELIERALPYQLGARTDYRFADDGVRCAIALPVSGTFAAPEAAGGGA